MATIVARFIDDAGTETAFKIALDQADFDRVINAYSVIHAVRDEDQKSPTFGALIPLSYEAAQRVMFEDVVAGWVGAAKRLEEDVAVDAARKSVPILLPPPIEIAAVAADVGAIGVVGK